MNEELRRRIKNFAEANYPRVGEHISLIECLKTITKDPSFNLEGESTSVLINKRKFELIDVYCPDLGEANSFLWDESAKIYLKHGEYVIEYIFDDTSGEISRAIIYEENETYRAFACGADRDVVFRRLLRQLAERYGEIYGDGIRRHFSDRRIRRGRRDWHALL